MCGRVDMGNNLSRHRSGESWFEFVVLSRGSSFSWTGKWWYVSGSWGGWNALGTAADPGDAS